MSGHVWIDELNKTQGENATLDQAVAKLKNELINFREMEYRDRNYGTLPRWIDCQVIIDRGNSLPP